MKPGVRALGVAESYREQVGTERREGPTDGRARSGATREATSTLAGSVVRASRIVDGFVFGQCTVGGSDATAAVCEMVDRLDREDVRYCFLAGVAPAWFNVLDLRRIHEETGLPTISVSFEESPGLETAIREAVDDEDAVAERIETYRDQPPRRHLAVNGETVFVRNVGIDDGEAETVVRRFTPEGGRPEPLRVARLAARAADAFARS